MNELLYWLLLTNMYLLIVGLLFSGLRVVLYKLNGSKSLLYQMWMILPVGLLVLTVLLRLETNISLLGQLNLQQLPTILVASQSAVPDFWKPVLITFWLLIAVIGLISLLIKYTQLSKLLKAKTDKLNPSKNSCVESPLAFGIFPAKIYVPITFEQQFSPEQQQLLLEHEQVHCNRHDPLMRIIYKILLAIFWFNPIVYVVNYLMKKDQEISCDEIVLRKNKKRAEYSKLLLKINQNNSFKHNKLPELYCSSLSTLKERIMLIKDLEPQKTNIQYNIMSYAIMVVAVVGLIATTVVLASEVTPQAPNIPSPDEMTSVTPSTTQSDNKIIPIVRIAPHYPRSAALEKITGYVTVEFDIKPNGHVGATRVVDSEPAGIFDKEAIASVKKYKFAPIAQTTSARQKVEFKLD